jgi:hypothetical protein
MSHLVQPFRLLTMQKTQKYRTSTTKSAVASNVNDGKR